MISLIFYIIFTWIVLLSAHKASLTKNGNRSVLLPYILIFIVSAIRFDIGADYDKYFYNSIEYAQLASGDHNLWWVYQYLDGHAEISFLFFSKIFSFSPYPLIFINAVYSLITLTYLYKILNKINGHFWGVFVFIVCEYLFITWDGIRQGVSLVTVIYAFLLLKEDKYKYYFINMLVAFLFHQSALYMLSILPLKFISVRPRLLVLVIFGSITIYLTGFFNDFVEQATIIFQYTSGKYEDLGNIIQTAEILESVLFKIRTIFYCIFAAFIVYRLPKEESAVSILITGGFILYMISNGSLTFMRIAWYFMFFLIIAVPIVKRRLSGIDKKLFYCFVIVLSLLYLRDLTSGSNTRGCVPYNTVFSNEFEYKKFTPDNY